MAVWKAFIDCAGSKDSAFIATGIALATASTWNKIMPRWSSVLNKYQLTQYHASKFNNFEGEYSKLTPQTQLSCHKELIEILGKVNLQFIIHVLRRSEFNLALRSARISKEIEAYDYLLEIGISDLKNWGDKKGLGTSIQVFIEAGEKHNSIVFQDLLKLAKKRVFGRIQRPEFVEKKNCLQIQIADLIAHEGYKDATNEVGHIKRPERKSFTAIKAGNPLRHFLHHSVSAKYWLENIHNGIYGAGEIPAKRKK